MFDIKNLNIINAYKYMYLAYAYIACNIIV